MNNKKYYWLKMDRGFFKRHDITIIESMPNGVQYVIFYLKLLLESIDHNGQLRFNETIPYNEEMLATITRTNIDIVRSAVKIFKQLGLMQILDDETIYLSETTKMLGESSSTHRVQAFRERQKQLQLTNETLHETLHETYIDIDIEKDKELDKDKEIYKENGKKPSTKKDKKVYGEFKNVYLTEEQYNKLIELENGKEAIEFFSEAKKMKGYKYNEDYLAIKKWGFSGVGKTQKPKSNIDYNNFGE